MRHLLKLAFLLLAMLLPGKGAAHDFEVDGIYYNINGNEAIVTYKGTTSSEYSNEYSGMVTIPSSVTYSGTTYSVTSIDDMAFEYCSNPMRVTIPNTIVYIGYKAFNRCYNMWSITIPNSVTYIGDYAFMGCSGLTNITIPNSVTTIGDHTFWYCTGLKSVTIPNSVTLIDDNAFYGCSKLTSIDIPNSVTHIGDKAFCICSSLTSLEIPQSVTHIGDDAFMGCINLINVTVASGNRKYDSRNLCNAIIETATNKLIYGCKNTSIPNSITSIGEKAFYYCSSLTNLTIPNSVTSIDWGAFAYCSGLTSINISNSVTYIGKSAFQCSRLTSVTIPNSVTYIGEWAFSDCSSLINVTIGNSVSTISNYAFLGCSKLKEIYCLAVIPPTIYNNTFSDSYEATLHVPQASVSEYQSANYWCNFNQIINITTDFVVNDVRYHSNDNGSAIVVGYVEEEQHDRWELVIPESVTHEGQTFQVTEVVESAFDGCFDLTSVAIPNTVTCIGNSAFQGCTELTKVTIGSGVDSIGAKAFNYCNSLQKVTCLGIEPPAMANADCFTTTAYNRATLCVEWKAMEAYRATDHWYKFVNVQGFGSSGPGDVDGDGEVSIADITAIIDHIMGQTNNTFYEESADVNCNGTVNIADVVDLIDKLL